MNTRVRDALIRAYGHTCQYCVRKFTASELEVDHIDAVSCGGSDSLFNLTLACARCNQRKSNLHLEEPGRSLLVTIAKSKSAEIFAFLNGGSSEISLDLTEGTITIGGIVADGDYVKPRWAPHIWIRRGLIESMDPLAHWE